jgi:hypothetical protein
MYRVKSLEGVNYWQAIRQVGEVGVLGLIVAAVGTGVMLAARGSRRATVAWLGYSAVLALVASRLAFQPFRNLLSIVPFLCIAMAAAVVAVAEVLARETPTRGRRWARTGAIVVLTMVLAGVSFQSGVRPFYAANVNVDTRVVARRWLQAHVRAGDKVIVAAELGIAQRELKQIPGTVEVVSIHDKVVPADLAGVRYVVTGLPFAGGFSWLPGPGFTFLESWGATPLPEASNLFRTNMLLVQVAEDRP